jgi:uncharacterized protein (DUF1501 family)
MFGNLTSSACDAFQRARLTRRHLLQVGGISLLGLHLPGLLHAAERSAHRKARAKAIILLHQYGGPSHVDTLDMKPSAPDAIRGEFKPIATKVPGLSICERLPRLAQVADKFTLLRSLYHEMKNHNSAGYYSLTGHAPPTDDQRLRDSRDLFPAYGSVVDRLAPAKIGVPTFVSYPYVIRDGSITPGQQASFLGKAHDPFFIGQDPNSPDFRLPELSLPANLTLDRLENRREVQRMIDRQSELLEFSARARGIDANYEKALTMLTAPRVKKAFDLSEEPISLRARYGRTTFGQGCLLARRLVEAGARFINVYFAASIGGQGNTGGWDTHGFNNKPMYPILKNYLLPITDQAVPTLLEDLDERGLLEETLVVWMGEFGRSPRINSIAGRDHWPKCYTALLAGGGVRRGFIYGSSDRIGAYPASDAVRPDDLAATMFYLFGIDPQSEVHDALNRPLPISQGKPITGLSA